MAPHPQRLTVTRRAWPLARPLMTADGVVTTVDVVVAEIADGEDAAAAKPCRFGSTARASTASSPRLMR